MPESGGGGNGVARVSAGPSGADEILGGGFPRNSIVILTGQPGTGKTIFAEQMLFHNAGDDRPVLYLATLTEPLSKLVTFLQRFEFFDERRIGDSVIYDDIGPALAEHGPTALIDRLRAAIRDTSPKLIVVDSFKVLHDLVDSPGEMRRLLSDMAGLLSAYDVTTFLVGEYSDDEVRTLPEFAVADGIVEFARRSASRRDERFVRVLKLRGSGYLEGAHAFTIGPAGLRFHPRLALPAAPAGFGRPMRRLATGVAGLDAMLDGGIWSGSVMLVTGPSGTGKTTLGLQFAAEGALRGEPALVLNFQENPTQLARSFQTLGLELDARQRSSLEFRYVSPVELQIDSIIADLFEAVEAHGICRLVIDSLDELARAAGSRERLQDYLYSLAQQLIERGVTTMMTLESDFLPERPSAGWYRMSPIADCVVELGLVLSDPPHRTLRIVKGRGTAHDLRSYELRIDNNGVHVLQPVSS